MNQIASGDEAKASSPPRADRTRRQEIVLAIGAIATVAAVTAIRLRVLDMPLERDEGEFAHLGQLILRGIPPYVAAFNMKWPGVYYIYAAIMTLFGPSVRAIHAGLMIANLGSAALIYYITKTRFGRREALCAAPAFLVLTVSPTVLGLAAHATQFVCVAALAGIALIIDGNQHRRLRNLVAGVCFGIAAVCKQPGAVFFVFGLYWLLVRPANRSRWIELGELSSGFGFCIFLMLASIYLTGAWQHFWFWTWTYAQQYGGIVVLANARNNLLNTIVVVGRASLLLWATAVLGVIPLFAIKRYRRETKFLVPLIILSLFSTSPGLYFTTHYFIPFMPFAAMLCGVFVWGMHETVMRTRLSALGTWAVALLIPLGVAQSLWLRGDYFFRESVRWLPVSTYGFNAFAEDREIANFINEHYSKSQSLAVVGSEPEIYFYTGMRPVTGYMYVYPLMEKQPLAARMKTEFIRDIEEGQPDVVVFPSVMASWQSNSPLADMTVLGWFRQYADLHLNLVGLIEINADAAPTYTWFPAGDLTLPRTNVWIAVFERVRDPHAPRRLVHWE